MFLAGGQIGYNWQNERWVFGVELDASRAASDGTNTCLAASSSVISANCSAGPSVFATGTGRLGYAFGPHGQTLVYLKGGLAWQNNSGVVANNNEFAEDSTYRSGRAPQNSTRFAYGRVGGTIGVGVEQALTNAWSLSLEYDYLKFNGPSVATPPTLQYPPFATVPANTTGLSSSYHIGKLGLNYHFDALPQAPEPDTPLYAKKPTVSASPSGLAGGWSLEGGTRLWLSRGRFQWDVGSTDLISRLTYHGLDGISGELFERLDSPWGIFLKGNIGFGRFNDGKINNEDWGVDPLAYQNHLSGQGNGRFTYYTADAGYDVLRGSTYKAGGFMGWSYYGQKSDSIGCVQTVSSKAPCLAPGDRRIIGSQDTDWNALRVGISAETTLLDRWRINADIAYLPWTDFRGRDNHLLRHSTTFDDQRGSGGGGGVQLEAALSYSITKNVSVGIGGRYWAMWTPNQRKLLQTTAEAENSYPVTYGPSSSNYRMERWGTFFQASYKFD
ncbi:hypothetical protein BCCGELA001_29180 [Bradyrhizobium sp. CCGE-LA001]|nr:hypothetical protein BCCGELA001_29180 [Bradyrhizobium sp. CCGE-LA001]